MNADTGKELPNRIDQRWEQVGGRVRRVNLQDWMRDDSQVWRPDPGYESSPEFPRIGQPGIERFGFLDLDHLEKGSLVKFYGSHPSAYYIIRVIGGGDVKIWNGGQVGGLIGPSNAISVFDHASLDRGTNTGDVYYGVLIRDSFMGMKPRVRMPYFRFDQSGRIQQQRAVGSWTDFIKEISIKRGR